MTNSDLLFRMLNPKLNAMLRNSLDEFKELMTTRGDMNAVYICDAIKDLPLDASTYTAELIRQTCELHNVAPIILDTVQDNFDIMSKFTQDEVTITARNYRKLLSLGAVDKFKGMAGSDPLKFLELIKNYELVDSAEVEDPDIYRTVNFLDMDVKKVEEASGNVIPSCFSVVNDNTRGGYYTGQLVVFSGAPGCFFGDTEVMTLDHSKHTLEELYKSGKKNIEVYCCDENGNLKVSKAEECKLTKYVNDYVEVNIDGKIIKCTPDHPYMLDDGTWVQAKDLIPNDGLMPIHRKVQPHRRSLIYGDNGHADSGYEALYTFSDLGKDNSYTHQLAAEYLDPDKTYFCIHHNLRSKDNTKFDSLNNEFSNLVLCKSRSEHQKIHCQYPEGRTQVLSAGFNTRFNSETISELNRVRWKDPEYRMHMMNDTHIGKFGEYTKDIIIARNSGDKSDQKKSGVRKFLNGLIRANLLTSSKQITEEFYQTERYKYEFSNYRTPSFSSAMHYYDNNLDEMYKDAVNYSNHTVLSVTLRHSDKPIPVYDLVNVDKYHNFAIYIDGNDNEDSGVIVHNSGKSLAMMNESVNMCRMGLKVKYTAIGDITEFDFMNRISGMVLDISMSSASLKQEYYYNILKEKHSYLSNLSLEFMAPDKFTVDDYISRLKVSGDYDNIDVFVIDYDTNFASRKTDSSYEKGDEIYNEVKVLASRPGKLVLMGAQPKIAYWSEEILELNSLSESSRKQQIIDMMITISHPATPNGANHVGIMNIAKNRRGSKGSCPYFLDKTGKMRNINKQDYDYFKIEEKPVTISRNPDGKSQSYNLGDAAREAQMSADKANDALKDNNDAQPGFTIPGMTFN